MTTLQPGQRVMHTVDYGYGWDKRSKYYSRPMEFEAVVVKVTGQRVRLRFKNGVEKDAKLSSVRTVEGM